MRLKNARQKGNKNRAELIQMLEKDGWKVAVVERTGRFLVEKDAFGIADLLCVRQDVTLLVQCATNRPHAHKVMRDFADVFGGPHLLVEQWVRIDGGEWKKFEY